MTDDNSTDLHFDELMQSAGQCVADRLRKGHTDNGTVNVNFPSYPVRDEQQQLIGCFDLTVTIKYTAAPRWKWIE